MNTATEKDRTNPPHSVPKTRRRKKPPRRRCPATRWPAATSIRKIRDILFGAQARDYERKFATLEEQLLKESADLRNDLKRRFDSLELYIKKEVEAITECVKT